MGQTHWPRAINTTLNPPTTPQHNATLHYATLHYTLLPYISQSTSIHAILPLNHVCCFLRPRALARVRARVRARTRARARGRALVRSRARARARARARTPEIESCSMTHAAERRRHPNLVFLYSKIPLFTLYIVQNTLYTLCKQQRSADAPRKQRRSADAPL